MIYDEAIQHVASYCSHPEKFKRLLKAGMNEDLFVGGVDPDEARMYSMAREWFLRDGTVPPREELERLWPQLFKTKDIPEDSEYQPEYVVKFLKNNAVKSHIQGITTDTIDRIFDEDADQVEELAKSHRSISELWMSVSGSNHTLSMEEAVPGVVTEIFERAEDAQAYEASLVKFPYFPLDDAYKGLKPRELAVFFGYTGDMKSFTVEHGSLRNALGHFPILEGDMAAQEVGTCISGDHSHEGHRVAHFTFENGIEQSTTRMLAMLSGIPLGHLSTGALHPTERERLRKARDVMATLPILIDESPGASERSVEAVFTKARMHEAELVIIDQANWIVSDDAKYRDMWANLATVTRKIQEHTNELEVVTFLAAQANRESQKTKKGTGLAHIAGTDELTKTASYAVSLDFDETTGFLLVSVVKARGGLRGLKFNMAIDLNIETRITLNSIL